MKSSREKPIALFIILTITAFNFSACNNKDELNETYVCNNPKHYLQSYASPSGDPGHLDRSVSDIFPFRSAGLTVDYTYKTGSHAVFNPKIFPSLSTSPNTFCSQGTGKIRVHSFLPYTQGCRDQTEEYKWEGALFTTDLEALIVSASYDKLTYSTGIIFESTCLDYAFEAHTLDSQGIYGQLLKAVVRPDCTFELFEWDGVTKYYPGINSTNVAFKVSTNAWASKDPVGLSQDVGFDFNGNYTIECD